MTGVDSSVPWANAAPDTWKRIRLRMTVEGCFNGIWGEEPDGQSDLVCVRVADFDRDALRIKSDDLTVRSIPVVKQARRRLQPGDLLLEKSGGGEVQPVGTVMLFEHAFPAVCSNFVARLPPSPGYSSRFLVYVHASLYYARVNTRSIKQTTGIQNLDSAAYLDETVAIPHLPVQRAIADFLDRKTAAIDELIRKKERLIELLVEKRQALITQAVTKGLDPNVPMKDSSIEWLGVVPKHWNVTRLKHFVHFLNHLRVPLAAEVRAGLEKVFPYYGASGVIDHVDDYLFDEPSVLVGEDGANILSRASALAFVATGKYWVNNHAHILRPKNGGDVQFWAARLEAVSFTPFATGSAQPKLTKEALGDLLISAPCVQEQHAIAEYILQVCMAIDPAILKLQALSTSLHEYRQALISAAVTGQLDIPAEPTP